MAHQVLFRLILPFLLAIVSLFSDSPKGVRGDYQRRAALIIIDVQDCFLPGGSLAVGEGDQVVSVINWIRREYGHLFTLVALSKDWHPVGHVSFADSHPGKQLYDIIDLRYEKDGTVCQGDSVTSTNFPSAQICTSDVTTQTIQQMLWPVHCVQNITSGPTSSALSASLQMKESDVIIYKGTRLELDSYSAFFDNGRFAQTDLNAILKSKDINTVFITGLALDYCVYYTSMDARSLGYETYTVLDAARGVAQSTVDTALVNMANKGVQLIQSDQMGDILHARVYPHVHYTRSCALTMGSLTIGRSSSISGSTSVFVILVVFASVHHIYHWLIL